MDRHSSFIDLANKKKCPICGAYTLLSTNICQCGYYYIIKTEEPYQLDLTTLAPIAARFKAKAMDWLISFVSLVVVGFIAELFCYFDSWNPHNGVPQVICIFLWICAYTLSIGYLLFADSLVGGQSCGKHLLGLQVISLKTGQPCRGWESFLRNAPLLVFSILDILSMFFRTNRQRAGDFIANTVVVKEPVE